MGADDEQLDREETDVEQRLREGLARQVASSPGARGLADGAVRRGRRTRRVRAAAVTVVGVAVTAVAVTASPLLSSWRDGARTAPAAASAGPPQVVLALLGGKRPELVDWPDGVERHRALGDASPVAQLPSGVLLRSASGLSVLGPDAIEPSPVLEGQVGAVAVSPDGGRVAVVSGAGAERRLRELEVPSGRELRSVAVAEPLASPQTPLRAVAYSGAAVLVAVGEGDGGHTALWEAGDGAVVGDLTGYVDVVGGAPAGTGDGPGGRGAFTVAGGGRCSTTVAELRTGGRSWQLCSETFLAFSPRGATVLAGTAVGDRLVVRRASDGDRVRQLDVPEHVRAAGWEGEETLLYAALDHEGSRTLVVRCLVAGGSCRTVATFASTAGVPQPLPRFGVTG